MAIKDVWENHPGRILLAAVAATAGAVSGVTGLVLDFTSARNEAAEERHVGELQGQKLRYERRIDTLEADLAGIARRAGESVLDVRAMTVTEETARTLPSSLDLDETDHFFAMRPTDGWKRTRTTELELLVGTTGLSAEDLVAEFARSQGRTVEEVRQALTAVPVHVWRNVEAHRVEGVPGLAMLRPQVLVQRIPHATFGRILVPRGEADDEAFAGLARFYRGDSTGLVLAQQLQLETGIQQETVQSWLESVEKSGNVVYARTATVLAGVPVDGQRREKYYLTRELILLSTPDSLYMVKTFDPRSDLRSGPNSAWITRWLGSFKVVTQT